MPPDAAPPADLPVQGHSISSFLDLLSALLADNRTAEFVILFLTGQYNGEQVSIEALRNRIYNQEDDDVHEALLYPYNVSRDIDSALGISNDICVQGQPIVFYVIPKYSGSLKSSVGISHRISVDGIRTQVKLHKIPNYLFAHWGIRNEIIIFFPGLYKKGEREGYKVDNADIALFFENVTRPSLLALMPDLRAANLPPTFDAEMWRARSESGHFISSGRVLSESVVRDLSGELRDKLEDAIARGVRLEWAREFIFLHQIRGVKDANAHHPTDAADALRQFIHKNHISEREIDDYPENWYIDVGLEISSATGDNSMAWRADSHTALLRDILDIPEVHAVRMTKAGSSSYYKDPVSHLTEVAGCRIMPGVRGRGPLEIVKIQVYHTDKTITAAVGGGHHAKHISLHQLINDKDGGFLDKLFQVYEDSLNTGVVANARLEVRVPFHMHSRVYDGLEGINWRRYLVAVPCDDWWTLRLYALMAYKAVASG